MIVPFPGAAFTSAAEGDMREEGARRAVSGRLGIPPDWATVRQVHGARVVEVTESGRHGPADALFTRVPGLPLAVLTADCVGVVVSAAGGVGVAHAGWRGMAGGVLEALVGSMRRAGLEPRRAVGGPAIGPCCYEVGPDVADRFPSAVAATSWGTTSVDLVGEAGARLEGVPFETVDGCTRHEGSHFSHRRDRTAARMAAIGWWSP